MNAPVMSRRQNAIALFAVVLAAVALLPISPSARIACAALAGAAIVMLLVVRLRAHRARRDAERVHGVYDRIERIRAEREKLRRRSR
ncbi:MAG TPA: hypothetical protein VHS78_08650 [Candidatus Elarobacter sp.]|nr:hypothetical protein [Candidatus Elarobacter sp.]